MTTHSDTTNAIANAHLETWYWKIRAVLQTSKDFLESPHPLWSDVNELPEICAELEIILNIPNGYEEN